MAKSQLVKMIEDLNNEIMQLEDKRSRSMAAIIESLISRTTPDEEEVEFFRAFSSQIDAKRAQVQILMKKLGRPL